MLKGIQKNMIMIKLPKSPHFEAAYFIIRTACGEPKQGEMVREANKIISDSGLYAEKKSAGKGHRLDKALFFTYGALSGALSVAAVWLGFLIWA